MYNSGDFGRETEARAVRAALRGMSTTAALNEAIALTGAPLNIAAENINPDGKGYVPLRCDTTPMDVGKLGR